MEKNLIEHYIPKVVVAPVDLNAGNNVGNRVDMKGLRRVTFLAILGAGAATTTHSFALKQHTVPVAGVAIPLLIDNPYYTQIGVAQSFTRVNPPAATDTFDLNAALANNASMVVFEVLPEQMTQGYRYVSIDFADAGGAQVGTIIALGETEDMPAYKQVV